MFNFLLAKRDVVLDQARILRKNRIPSFVTRFLYGEPLSQAPFYEPPIPGGLVRRIPMRLTLRALLAYLDDVLDPATLKEIGARISESAPASATVSRIKEVVRRRRIAAPELTGSGSAPDPNLVAEYLDNTLAPDAVPALEKLCLESDMHLAEVASAHQILTAVLGEPVDVPVSTRERMYALVSQAPLIEQRSTSETPSVGTAGPSQLASKTALPMRSPMTPDYLKPSAGRKLVLGVLAVCLTVGWLGWVLKDQGLLPGGGAKSVAVADQSTENNEESLVVDTPTEGVQPVSIPVADDKTVALASNEAVAAVKSPASIPPMEEPAVPNVSAPGEVGLAPQPTVPEPPAAAVVAQNSFPAIFYANAEGILLGRDRQSGQWNVMPRRALIHEGDEIATPDPFQSEFTVDGNQLEVVLFGGARIRLDPRVGTELLSIHIDRGRIAIRRPPAGESQDPVSIRLSLEGQVAILTLNEPGTQCGLEVHQRAPQGRLHPDPRFMVPEGGINVVNGSVALAWNGAPAVAIGSEIGWAEWPVPQSPVKVGPQRAIPDWLNADGVSLTAADKKWHQMFEKEFAIDQPVSKSIPALVSDRRETISSLATYTLGLVDDIPMLVKALQSEYEETRRAAIWGLRGWLLSDPNNTALLEMEVARIFPDEDVDKVVELLWGYKESDAKDPAISRQLLEWMDHNEIAIRELAFYHVSQLTARHNAHGYRASLADAPRNAALMGWRSQIEKNGGQLVK